MLMDLIGLHLRESLQGEGCPVCRSLDNFERSVIENILYEGVNGQSLRWKFKEKLGVEERDYSEVEGKIHYYLNFEK